MVRDFEADRPFLVDEFALAEWQNGLTPQELEAQMMETVNAHPDYSMIKLRGLVFHKIVETARIAINPHSIFAAKIDFGVTYGEYASRGFYCKLYEFALNKVYKEHFDKNLLAQKSFANNIGVGFGCTDYWHTMPDWQNLLRYGFLGLKKRLESARDAHIKDNTLSEDKAEFYESALMHIDACFVCIDRMRKMAEEQGLLEFAQCLEEISMHAPQTLYQAMETMILYLDLEEMGVERGRTLGRLDVFFAPFYRKMIAEGADIEEIKNLFRYFFMRFQAARRFAAQPFAIGGKTPDGANGDVDLIMLMLDVFDELNIRNPKIHVRVHDKLPERVIRKLMYLIRKGNSAIVFINEKTVIKAYERIGIPYTDAVTYTTYGCYEPMLPGLEDAMIGASWCNMAKAVEFAMNGGRDPITGKVFAKTNPGTFTDFEDFYNAVKEQIRSILRFIREAIEAELPWTMEINPSPLYSATIDSCIESGKDVFGGGMKYHNVSIKCFGIGTLTDAILAVKRFVFEKKEISFDELRAVLNANWENHEKLRQKILNDPIKYGNNIEEADSIAVDIYKCIASEVTGKDTGFGGKYRLGGDSINNCIGFARAMGATPDGRKKGEPVSKNFSPTSGMERNGVTAFIESAGKFDYADFANAAVVDLTVHKSAVQGDDGLNAMCALLKVAFDKGIFALQGNVLDLNELLDAQKHPENYQDLQIRLCGWNEYWVNMGPEKQNAFIKRMQAE